LRPRLHIVGGTDRRKQAAKDIRALAAFISADTAYLVAGAMLREGRTLEGRRKLLAKTGVPPGRIPELLRKYGLLP
jgi:hypothetical protein